MEKESDTQYPGEEDQPEGWKKKAVYVLESQPLLHVK